MHAQPGGAGRDAAYGRLFDLIRHVTSSRDVDELLGRVVRGVVEGLGFGTAVVNRREGDELVCTHLTSATASEVELKGRRVPLAVMDELDARAEQWGILRFVGHDRQAGDAFGSLDPEVWHPLDVLYAPLNSPTGELLGTMSVDLPPGLRLPDRRLRELLEMYVVQAGLALSHAQQREVLERRMRLGRMVTDVSTTADLVDLRVVLDTAARSVTEAMGAAQTFVRCLADPSAPAELVTGFPLDEPPDPGIEGLSRDLEESAWPERRAVVLDLADPQSHDLPRSLPVIAARTDPGSRGRLVLAGFGTRGEMLGHLAIVLAADRPPLDADEEHALQEVCDELGQIVMNSRLYDRESRLVAELQELDRYKGELIATISHELKTPLTSIIGHAELLDDDPETSASVRAITRNAFRLDRLIANLLSYSRLHEPRAHQRLPVDLVSLCRASVELLDAQASSADLRFHVRLPRDGVMVRGDVDEIGRVIDNLVGNAVKYSRRGGRIWITAGYDGTEAMVAVRDDGLGISPADQAHVFTPFHRSSNPQALSLPGTGLGLAISRRIAELHGGAITLDSELGSGSAFTLRLPSAQPAS